MPWAHLLHVIGELSENKRKKTKMVKIRTVNRKWIATRIVRGSPSAILIIWAGWNCGKLIRNLKGIYKSFHTIWLFAIYFYSTPSKIFQLYDHKCFKDLSFEPMNGTRRIFIFMLWVFLTMSGHYGESYMQLIARTFWRSLFCNSITFLRETFEMLHFNQPNPNFLNPTRMM